MFFRYFARFLLLRMLPKATKRYGLAIISSSIFDVCVGVFSVYDTDGRPNRQLIDNVLTRNASLGCIHV
jgi:hypothetical protein